jgi:hypothetical protein
MGREEGLEALRVDREYQATDNWPRLARHKGCEAEIARDILPEIRARTSGARKNLTPSAP